MIDAHKWARRQTAFDLGVAMNAAQSDNPTKALLALLDDPDDAPPTQATGMLAIPKKREE